MIRAGDGDGAGFCGVSGGVRYCWPSSSSFFADSSSGLASNESVTAGSSNDSVQAILLKEPDMPRRNNLSILWLSNQHMISPLLIRVSNKHSIFPSVIPNL